MSAAPARALAARSVPSRTTGRPAPVRVAPQRAALRLVPQRRSSAARAPFVGVVALLLGAGLLGLLALNTVLAQDAFRLHALQKEGRALADREQSLQHEVDSLQAPAELARRAVALGMVDGGSPAFLRLPDGAVLGEARPVLAPQIVPPAAPAATSRKPASSPAPASAAQPGRQPVAQKAAAKQSATPAKATASPQPRRATPSPSAAR